MGAHNNNVLRQISVDVEPEDIVSFKGEFLDKLIDAVALIELVDITVRHHDEIDFNTQGFLGVSLLLQQVKELLNVDASLLPHGTVVPTRSISTRLDS